MPMSNVVYWLDPKICIRPHSVSRPDDVIDFANQFVEHGWDPNKPRLIGYPYIENDFEKLLKIQLLTGTHRHAAAQLAGILIPVIIRSFDEVKRAAGDLNAWKELLNDRKD